MEGYALGGRSLRLCSSYYVKYEYVSKYVPGEKDGCRNCGYNGRYNPATTDNLILTND